MTVRFGRALVACAIASMLAVPFAASAQRGAFGQPIYPGYQGFLDNPDGSVTMVFQYFSHGRDPVELPIGPQNRFTGVEDRNQPTTFQPGNHEFVCLIVMENRKAAQELRWTVAFPEAESVTSLDPLNKEYMLTERSRTQANRELDLETAPRGVCVNKPPRVRSKPRRFFGGSNGDENQNVEAKVGEELELRGSVTDEALPRDGKLVVNWRLVDGPGTADFVNPNEAQTAVVFSVVGTYELELHATDGELESVAGLSVTVD
jgi:hypothetical protein